MTKKQKDSMYQQKLLKRIKIDTKVCAGSRAFAAPAST